MTGNGPQVPTGVSEKRLDLQAFADICSYVHKNQVRPAGVEPAPKSPEKQHVLNSGGTKSGTVSSSLAQVMAAWAELPEHIQAAILTLCRLPNNREEAP